MSNLLSLGGLLLTFAGSAVLYWNSSRRKSIGNMILDGNFAMKFEDPSVRDVPESEWQPEFEKFMKGGVRLSRIGFACIAVGTAFQIAALIL